ncbi:MAG: phenylacetate--CoA ligase family protein, partial [Planctomycetes bacterium]|nr:phenylacetate--CoA ligase family protein [Planctomycetota bacterium]
MQNRLLARFVEERLLPFSPFYRALFAEHGIRKGSIQRVEDLARVPFTTKGDLAPTADDPDRPRRFILQPTRELIGQHWSRRKRLGLVAKALLRGKKRVGADLRREYYPIFMTFTTGRSAQPVPFVYSRHDLDIVSEAGLRLCETLGFLPDERGLNVFPFAPHLAFWQVALGAMEVGNLMLHTGGGKVAGTEGNLRGISRMRPHNLLGVPGYIYHMLREARARGQRIEGLKTIVLGADAVPAGLKLKLRTLCAELGSPDVRVLGTYGFTEARMAFAECPTPDGTSSGYHVFPDFGIFEIIDPVTGEVLPDEADGELVYTPLQGRGTTVFRYRTGDLVQGGMRDGPCPYCGRTLPRI